MKGTGEDSLTLDITKNGGGAGVVTDSRGEIDCGSACSATYTQTTSVLDITLSATAGAGSAFGGWSGGGCTGTAQCVVTLGAATTTVTATFTPQWTTLGTSSALGAYVPQLTAALNGVLYYASTTQMESFNTANNAFARQSAQATFSNQGPMFAGPGDVYYQFGTGVVQFSGGAWSSVLSGGNVSGAGSVAVGTTVYSIGATGPYDGAWVLIPGGGWSVITSPPIAVATPCTGADPTRGKFYFFGGNTPANPNTYGYTISSSSWATVATNGPLTCQSMATTTWNGNLVYADPQGVHQFNLSLLSWGATPLPLPSSNPKLPVALSTGTTLYLLGYDGVSTTTVYQWNP